MADHRPYVHTAITVTLPTPAPQPVIMGRVIFITEFFWASAPGPTGATDMAGVTIATAALVEDGIITGLLITTAAAHIMVDRPTVPVGRAVHHTVVPDRLVVLTTRDGLAVHHMVARDLELSREATTPAEATTRTNRWPPKIFMPELLSGEAPASPLFHRRWP